MSLSHEGTARQGQSAKARFKAAELRVKPFGRVKQHSCVQKPCGASRFIPIKKEGKKGETVYLGMKTGRNVKVSHE